MKQGTFLFYILLNYNIYAQQCTPTTYTFSMDVKQGVSFVNIKNELSKNDTTVFTQNVINTEWNRLLKCNDEFKSELHKIELEINRVSELKKELFVYQDLDALNRQLRDSRSNIEEVKKEVKKETSKVERKGLFAVLIKNLPYIPPPITTLTEKSNSILAPYAIEQINGTYIKRLTTTDNFIKVNDAIESMSNGNMKQVLNYSNTPNLEKRYFLYIVEVSVTPVLNSINTYTPDNSIISKVFSFDNNLDVLNDLRNEGVDEEDIERAKFTINERMSSIINENLIIENKHREELKKSNYNISQIEKEIAEINLKISNRSKKIEEICKKVESKFMIEDPNISAYNAKVKIESSIIKLTNSWNDIKEKEYFYKDIPASQLINPKEDLSRNVLELFTIINKEQGTIEGVEVYNKIENSTLKENIKKQTISVYRQIDKFWVAIIITDKRFFKIGFFAKFKITNERTLTIEEQLQIKAKREAIERENEKNREKEKKKEELKSKRKEAIVNTIDATKNFLVATKDFVLAADLLSLQYHIDTNYQLIDIGPRWGKFEEKYAIFGGASAGWHFDKNNAGGLALTTNFTYIKKEPRIRDFLADADIDVNMSTYYSFDARAGLGYNSFLSIEPQVGICFNKKIMYYFTVGTEIRTNSKARLGFHAGLNFIFNDYYKSNYREDE